MSTDVVCSDISFARAYIGMLCGHMDWPVRIRFIHDSDRTQPSMEMFGDVGTLWSEITKQNAAGYGVFMVVNSAGEDDARVADIPFLRDHDIKVVRAFFVDCDDKPIPETWHNQPDFTLQRDATHWHAYWIVRGLPPLEFEDAQRMLAQKYDTDPKVTNLSRVMRLPGTLNKKK